MKKILLSVLAAGIMLSSCEQHNSGSAELKNATDSLSYAIGLNIGSDFARAELNDLNYQALIQGMKDQVDTSAVPAMDMKEATAFIQETLMKKQEQKSAGNKKEGQDFLDANKTKEGVMTTPSGLQYKVITEGTGAKPQITDFVTVHYHGTLIDGTVFDSSVKRGEPASFNLGQVIPGWTEGLQLMSKGSKYMFYIPENLAYGGQDQGVIKPYSTLIFEVELLDIDSSGTPGGAGK